MKRLNKGNATVFDVANGQVLVSYSTKVALFDPQAKILFKTNKKWSATTSKQISQFSQEVKPVQVVEKDQDFFDQIKIIF